MGEVLELVNCNLVNTCRREFKIWLQPRRVVEREINNLSKNTKPKVTTCWLLPSHFLFLVSYKYNPKRREEKAFCILTGEKENKNKGWFEEIMQQHLMQMQPMMAAYASPNQVTTDIIQQYLDENKQLILAILDNQNTGKAEECAENQAKLQRNLMYLAAIADSQQTPTLAQFPPNPMLQSGPRYMPHQAAQQLTPQSLLAARASMLYPQSPMSSLQQQAALHGQLGVNPGASSGFNILHSEASVGFPDFGRGNSSKQEGGSALSTEGRGGGNSARQSGDGTESLYLKGSEEEGN